MITIYYFYVLFLFFIFHLRLLAALDFGGSTCSVTSVSYFPPLGSDRSAELLCCFVATRDVTSLYVTIYFTFYWTSKYEEYSLPTTLWTF